MPRLADVFPKVCTTKEVFRLMSEKSRLRNAFDKLHGKQPKHY